MKARPKTSVIRRILVQTDCDFWCIHDHLDVLAYLAVPTLAALLLSGLGLVWMWRTWEFPILFNFLVAGWLIPFLALLIFTALPLPCVVFVWKAADGEVATAGECSSCGRRAGRLVGVLLRLALLFVVSILLFGIPLLWVWPRTCLTPLVAPVRE